MRIKFFVLLIFLASYTGCISYYSITTDELTEQLKVRELNNNPKFNKWFQFWKSKIREVDTASLEKSDIVRTIHWSKINLDDWHKKTEIRNYTLNFSEGKNYVADVYNEDVFKYNNENIFVEGGDVDPSFVIISLNDSNLYYLTLGPYSFFDESIWTSDSTCYVLGFSFDDSIQGASNAYSIISILKISLNDNSIIIYNSKKLPYKKELMNFKTYMYYLYPEFIKL